MADSLFRHSRRNRNFEKKPHPGFSLTGAAGWAGVVREVGMMRRKLSQAEWAVIGLTALLLALMVGWRLGADSVRQLTAQAAALLPAVSAEPSPSAPEDANPSPAPSAGPVDINTAAARYWGEAGPGYLGLAGGTRSLFLCGGSDPGAGHRRGNFGGAYGPSDCRRRNKCRRYW